MATDYGLGLGLGLRVTISLPQQVPRSEVQILADAAKSVRTRALGLRVA